MWKRIRSAWLAWGVLLVLAAMQPLAAQKEEKLKLEDVVAKHLQALGAPEKVKAVTARRMEGDAGFKVIMGGTGDLAGSATYVSDGHKVLFIVDFDDLSYHGEQLNFDGAKLDIGTLRPGARTPVGDFLQQNLEILREGLFGGVLSTVWPLADLPAREAKLKYEGVKTINRQKVHVVRYQCKSQNSGLEIKLYFDPETFRHVGTLYKTSIAPPLAQTMHQAARQENLEYTLEESFSEFADINGVMLPAKWKLSYTRSTPGKGNSMLQWELNLANADPKLKKRGK